MYLIFQCLVEAVRICLRTLPVLAGTLVVMDLLTAFGLIRRLSFIVKPIARTARLSQVSTLALIAAVGSTLSADSMISRSYREGKINGIETLISAQANTLPAYLRECFTYFFPVIIPLLGIWPGMVYVSAFFLNVSLKIVLVMCAGRWMSKHFHRTENNKNSTDTLDFDTREKNWLLEFGTRLKHTARMVLQICILLLFAAFTISFLDAAGYLENLTGFIKPAMTMLAVPEKLFLPICSYLASPMAGAAAIGTFYKEGNISMYSTTIAALLGGVLSLTIATVRSTIPRNIALFGPRVGAANALLGFMIAFVSRLTLILIIAGFFPR